MQITGTASRRHGPRARSNGSRLRFPPGFVFGAATSGFQIEGAAHADGKGESIWDVFCRKPGAILHGDDGATACNAYDRRQLEGDLDLIAELGLSSYIFSIQWPRIQPDGRGPVNRKGLAYYERVVDGLLKRGVMPAATLYHWELPQALQRRGGWLHRATAARFADYAALLHGALADRVPIWVTQNEPSTSAWLGHGRGKHAPGLHGDGHALRAAHHLLLGHGLALQSMRAASATRTAIGPVLNLTPWRPADRRSPGDRAAARRIDGERNRLFLDPIFRARYPADVAVGRDESFIRAGDLATISTPLDFLGINYYSAERVAAAPGGGYRELPAEGEQTAMGWSIDPPRLRVLLKRVQREYSADLPLVVSENGCSMRDYVGPDGRCRDPERIDYLRRHLEEGRRAIDDGVPLKGWFVWSLLDNFEWDSGYRERFGLVHVDYATQTRTKKQSFEWFRELISQQPRARERRPP